MGWSVSYPVASQESTPLRLYKDQLEKSESSGWEKQTLQHIS